MPALMRPGVFIEERPPLTIPPAGTVSGSVGGFLGAATRGPTSAVLLRSFADFQRYFGDVTTAGELAFQVYSFFANGGGTAWCARVAGSGASAATRTLTDRASTPVATLTVNATNPGAWGNNLYIDVVDTAGSGSPATTFDLIVYFNGVTNGYVVERFTGLTMDPTQPNYALSVVNGTGDAGSKYISLAQPTTPSTTTAPGNLPSAQTGRQLTNGTDGSAVADTDIISALSLVFDPIRTPFMFYLPNASVAVQAAAVTYAQNRGDLFTINDLPVSTALSPSAAITAAAALPASSYGAVYWPNLIVADASSTLPGATRVQRPGGAVMGLYCLTDATRGIQKAPAGTAARLAGALTPQVQLGNADLDALAVAQVNAIRQIVGSGVVVMGARTLKPGASDRYVPIRRTLNFIKSNAVELSRFALFEPNTSITQQLVEDTLGRFLTTCWRQGILKGTSPQQAFYATCDATNNPATTVSQGIVNVELGVSLISPTEYIVIRIGQFEGGSSATEA